MLRVWRFSFVLFLILALAGAVSAPAYGATHYAWPGGHVSAGATSASDSWYFAEGCTRPGFDSWLCVMNPQDEVARLEISFVTPRGEEYHHSPSLQPHTRYTLNVSDVVGEGQDVSLMIKSDLPVVAERPMYSGYMTTAVSTSYPLAETCGLLLSSPISYQETVGVMYHEASRMDVHNQPANSQALIPLGGCVEDANPGARVPGWIPLRWGDPYYWIEESRHRGTFSTTAVDVGAKYGCPVICPIDGVVCSVEDFNLYGLYPDKRLAVIPDGRPDIKLVLVHLDDVMVEAGERVRAGETVLARVRRLSLHFQSDIGRFFTGGEGDHVHMQVNLNPR